MPTYHQLRLEVRTALSEFLDEREAASEVVRMFEEGLGRNPTWMVAHGDEAVPENVRRRVTDWVERRRKGEPWAYVLGWTRWRGRRFVVNSATLIPRPETELVLEAALETGRRLGVRRVVDVGTGSGILAITLALETDWEVGATDRSAEALSVARTNAEALGARVDFRQGHLLEAWPTGSLGLVVANLPYVDEADRPNLQRELAYEPSMALFAADRGLALNTELLTMARRRGAQGCVLEVGAGQGEELARRARNLGWTRVLHHPDWAGHDRILVAL